MSTEKSNESQTAERVIQDEEWRTSPLGYPRLAERMGTYPATLVFRQFTALNARILLYMQAELVWLERDLRLREQQDKDHEESNRSLYATDYYNLLHSHKDGNTTQLDLVNKIQGKLEVYSMSRSSMPIYLRCSRTARQSTHTAV
jgi:hypothetical protein